MKTKMHRRNYKHISQYFGWDFIELCAFKGEEKGGKRGRTKYRKKLRRIVRKIEKREVQQIINSEI